MNKWEGELELAETEVNIYSGVRIGISSLYPIRPTAPFQFCAVAVLTILDSYTLLVSARKPIQYSLNKALHKKEVQLSQEWFVTTIWPPFHACDTNMTDVMSCENAQY